MGVLYRYATLQGLVFIETDYLSWIGYLYSSIKWMNVIKYNLFPIISSVINCWYMYSAIWAIWYGTLFVSFSDKFHEINWLKSGQSLPLSGFSARITLNYLMVIKFLINSYICEEFSTKHSWWIEFSCLFRNVQLLIDCPFTDSSIVRRCRTKESEQHCLTPARHMQMCACMFECFL